MLLKNILIVLAFLWVQSGAGRVNRQLLYRIGAIIVPRHLHPTRHNRGSLTVQCAKCQPTCNCVFLYWASFPGTNAVQMSFAKLKNWKKSPRNQGIQALTEIASRSSLTNSRNNHHKILNKDNFAALPRNHPNFEKNKKNQHWTCFKVNFNHQISF